MKLIIGLVTLLVSTVLIAQTPAPTTVPVKAATPAVVVECKCPAPVVDPKAPQPKKVEDKKAADCVCPAVKVEPAKK